MHSLTIVIPALNEESAIADTISRCLDARDEIAATAGLDEIEIIVVSDGSTDCTVEVARSFSEVRVIAFDEHRGYGAAIKEGWRQGKGNLLAFLDADGTCDPVHFAPMCRAAIAERADIVLGSRLGPDSRMPRVRRIGNRIYAVLLGFLCGRHVTDTASGMRVVERSALRDLLPLPDGLHFTPSMSARALLNDLRVIELPMPYRERIGTSKLSVVRDGVRFLRAILSGVLCYRPEKIFLMGLVLCMVMALLLAAHPVEFYLQNGRVEEWMIYRFMACFLLGAFGLLLLLATALTNQMAYLTSRRAEAGLFWSSLCADLLHRRMVMAAMVAFLLGCAGVALWPGVVELVTTGHVSLHWSRLLTGAFALFSVGHLLVFRVLFEIVTIWKDQHVGREQLAPLESPQVLPERERELTRVTSLM
ncbi:MAG: glycosyltransferase family 2 protein [Acidobacteria bacterium]|nr:MAG: glycosyltransferase family 2 protein [Acidobacteriota bacterium]